MQALDWIVLFGTLGFIVLLGVVRSRDATGMHGFLLGNKSMPWWTVGLSIMATQASAITFLSTPGQAFEDGMRFIQFYFGLPLAMVILSITAVPLYHKLKVFTAYEYLETRFDVRVRSLAAFFFLMLRGFSVGITIYAPALILSTILGWNLNLTTILIGSLVLIYTVSGGSKAVSMTQRYQLMIIMGGMFIAAGIAFYKIPDISFRETFAFAGATGKLNLINLEFNPYDRYNIWSGLIGGLFLFLSYFGADQSQVGRYLAGSSVTESRMGLMFNGLLKIPMQFIILYIGVLVFVFYHFHQPPLIHNASLWNRAMKTEIAGDLQKLEGEYNTTFERKNSAAKSLVAAIQADNPTEIEVSSSSLRVAQGEENVLRDEARKKIADAVKGPSTSDRDYVFINFVLNNLPHGLIGLLLACAFLAAMSSMASELTALASTSAMDIYRRSLRKTESDEHYVRSSKWFTGLWAVFAIAFASMASQSENLIQLVNIVGSIFYGTILGLFLSGFYVKYVKSTAVFVAGIIAEAIVLYCYFFTGIAFLLYNIIGCVAVIVLAIIIQWIIDLTGNKDKVAAS
jgi:SSS family solute:Na+ symporter